jgi:hypothetical protein
MRVKRRRSQMKINRHTARYYYYGSLSARRGEAARGCARVMLD